MRVLIAGLGLGIVPAWLLAYARIDIIEIDADVTGLITRGCREKGAPNEWAADPRLHIHHGDAQSWWPGPAPRGGCAVHGDCVLQAGCTWHAAFFDIWDGISPFSLPSMHRLTRRYARRASELWSWERGEAPRPDSGVKSSTSHALLIHFSSTLDRPADSTAGDRAGSRRRL
jgi:hypothetical protein